ncbi:MAG TPA: hypothetical protein VIY27_06325 [Myxococcota bacterium]
MKPRTKRGARIRKRKEQRARAGSRQPACWYRLDIYPTGDAKVDAYVLPVVAERVVETLRKAADEIEARIEAGKPLEER